MLPLVYAHASDWKTAQKTPHLLKSLQETVQDVLVFSADDDVVAAITMALRDNFEVSVKHIFSLPSIDPSGKYRGYLLTLTRLDQYGEPVFPLGENVGRAIPLQGSLIVGWTGPGSDVILKFNLPAPTGDVMVQICGMLVTVALEDELAALVNQTPVTLTRQPAQAECDVRYTASIPQEAIPGDSFTEIALNIPVAPGDRALHNGNRELLGMAMTSITFSIEDTP